MQTPMPREIAGQPRPTDGIRVLYLSHKNPIREDEGAKIVIIGDVAPHRCPGMPG